jgi:hypothetical protein
MKIIRDAMRGVELRGVVMAVSAIVLAVLVVVGCRTPDTAAVFGQSIWGDFREAKSWMDAYKHVVVVCIYEDDWED